LERIEHRIRSFTDPKISCAASLAAYRMRQRGVDDDQVPFTVRDAAVILASSHFGRVGGETWTSYMIIMNAEFGAADARKVFRPR
jgi:hypothetical protein